MKPSAPVGKPPLPRLPGQPPAGKLRDPASIWDDDGTAEEPGYITGRQILPVVGWILGYLVIGLIGVPLIASLIYGGLNAGSPRQPDSGWAAMGQAYGILLAGLPAWFIGFPIIYFVMWKWDLAEGMRYVTAAGLGVVFSLAAAWAFTAST